MPPPSVFFQKIESTYVLPVPLSSTPFQLPVNVHRLTVAREPSNTVIAPDPFSA